MIRVRHAGWQTRLADEDLASMHLIAPFFEREERNRVANVRHAAVALIVQSRGVGPVVRKLEARVEIAGQRFVPDARLAERRYDGVPTASEEVEGCEGRDCAAEGVAD